jgi:hypothetical protein
MSGYASAAFKLAASLFSREKTSNKKSAPRSSFLFGAGALGLATFAGMMLYAKLQAEKEAEDLTLVEDDDPEALDAIKKNAEDNGEITEKGDLKKDAPEYGLISEVSRKMETPKDAPAIKPKDDSFFDRVRKMFGMKRTEPEILSKPPSAVASPMILASGGELAKNLPKDYRSQFNFTDMRNAEKLSKSGTYTKQEADTIVYLRKNQIDTSAHPEGGMPSVVESKIRARAKAYGLDPEMMLKVASLESGGNPNAISATGAIGIFQFTGKTATGYGIRNRFDIDQNIEAGMRLTKWNAQNLEKNDLPLSAINLYMMHQLGPVAAKEVIRAASKKSKISSLSSRTQSAIRLNYGGRESKTADEFLRKNEEGLDIKYRRALPSSNKEAPPISSKPVTSNSKPLQQKAEAPPVKQLKVDEASRTEIVRRDERPSSTGAERFINISSRPQEIISAPNGARLVVS